MPPTNPADNDTARRAYWAQQMDDAYAFMMRALDYPVQECAEPLVSLQDAAADAGVEVAFSTTKVIDDLDRLFYLRRGLIDDFVAVASEMNERGWVLEVEDAFRTPLIQKRLACSPRVFDAILKVVMWEIGGKVPDVDLMVRRQASLTASSPKVGTHMSATAMDISVLNRDTGQELDRGGPYIEFSELTPMASPFICDQAKQNRAEITAVMNRAGFLAYPYEFWHYNKDDAYCEMLNETHRPARYGPIDYDAKTNTVTPVENPTQRLNTPAEIEREMALSLTRLGY